MSGEVYGRWAKVLAGLSHIPKQRSEGVSYEFRGIDAVMQHLHPLLAANELTLSPRVLPGWQVNPIPGSNNRTQYQALFALEVDVIAPDGSTLTLGPGLAQSHDYGDKAVYQAQQNAMKYVLLEALCVPVGEPDMDGRTPDSVPTVVPADPGKLQAVRDLYDLLPEGATSKSLDELLAYAGQSDAAADATVKRLSEALDEAQAVDA